MPKKSLLMLALVVALDASAYGWNNFGHETVAYLAYQQLTPKTRTRVKALLKLNPYYKRIWPSMLPPAVSGPDRDMMIFMIASTWPDQIKSDGSYHSDVRVIFTRAPEAGGRWPTRSCSPSGRQRVSASRRHVS
jgi:S1/P1 Nuclease